MKLTEWFPGTIKPVRVGVYMQMDGLGKKEGYQYWDGSLWGGFARSPDKAFVLRHHKPHATHQNDSWRGILKEER